MQRKLCSFPKKPTKSLLLGYELMGGPNKQGGGGWNFRYNQINRGVKISGMVGGGEREPILPLSSPVFRLVIP